MAKRKKKKEPEEIYQEDETPSEEVESPDDAPYYEGTWSGLPCWFCNVGNCMHSTLGGEEAIKRHVAAMHGPPSPAAAPPPMIHVADKRGRDVTAPLWAQPEQEPEPEPELEEIIEVAAEEPPDEE